MAGNEAANTPGANGMDKTCQGVTFRISTIQMTEVVAQDTPKRTELSLIGPAGAVKPIENPLEMADYTPIGLGCAVSKADSKPYFVVQFGELPYGCNFCEWFYLYDENGTQLTTSNPPILVDKELPEGKQQTSNTKEYESMIKKLEIMHPEVTYIE